MITEHKSLLIGATGFVIAAACFAVGILSGGYRAPDFGHHAPFTVEPSKPQQNGMVQMGTSASTRLPTPQQHEIVIPPLPADATSVPDDDLLRLCAMVGLANSANQPPDLKGWKQALPIAEQLQQGPCDCEQRNWLHHFVETGNSALGDSSEQYLENARLMLTLARNDQQAMALSHKAN